MAQPDEVLIKIVLDEQATEKRIVAIRQQMTFLKSTVKDLQKDFADGRLTSEEYEAAQERVARQTKVLSDELRTQRKALEDNHKSNQAATGSLAEMRAKLSLNTAAYVALSKEERENEQVGGRLRQTIRALSDDLKANEEQLGDNRRSVGDYAKGIRVFGVSIGEAQEAIKGGSQAFGTFVKGIGAGRLALTALIAVPVVAVLVSLYAIVTKSQSGMDKLAQYTKAASLGFDAFTSGVIRAGRIILDAFTSFDKFKNLLGDLRDNADATTTAIGNAARAGIEIEKANQRIEASEIKVSVARAQNRAEVERQKLIAEDVSKSTATRAVAAKRAFDLENQSLQTQLKLQQEKIANIQRENAIGEQTREKDRKLAEARIELADIEEESLGRQTELNNNLNSIRQDGLTKAKEARILAAAESVAEAERALIRAKQLGKDTLAIEEEVIRRRAVLDKAGIEKGAAQRKLVDAKANAEILQLRLDHLRKIEAATAQATEDTTNTQLLLTQKGTQKEYELQLQLLIDQNKREKAAAVDAAEDNVELRAGLTRRLRLIDAKYHADSEALEEQFNIDQINRVDERTRRQLQGYEDATAHAISEDRKIAARRIELEEETQLGILKVQRDAAQKRLSATDTQGLLDLENDYQARVNQVQAKAIRERRELAAQERVDGRNDLAAQIEAQLFATKEGSKQQYQLLLYQLKIQRVAELDNEKLTVAEKAKINADYDKRERDLVKKRSDDVAGQIIDTTGRITSQISTLLASQQQQIAAELDRQQVAALNSAGTNAQLRLDIEETYQKKKLEAEKEAARDRQKIARIEAIINTAKEITSVLHNPFLVAIAAVAGLAQQVIIGQQQFADGGVPQYFATYQSDRRGNYLAAGPGSTRSDSIPARISVGESVINAAATAKHYNLLSAINQSTGGRQFPGATLTEIPQFQSGIIGIQPDTGATLSALVDRVNGIQQVLVLESFNQVQKDQQQVQVKTTY